MDKKVITATVPPEVRQQINTAAYGSPLDKVANAAFADAIMRRGWGEQMSVSGIRSEVRADEAAVKAGAILIARDIGFGDCRGEGCEAAGSGSVVCLVGDEALLAYDDDESSLTILARTRAAAEQAAKQFLSHFPPVKVEASETEAVFDFTFRTSQGTSRYIKRITTGRWADIRGNYPATCAERLDGIAQMKTGPNSGRLCLLRGPTGTGKTYFLLSLAREWREWAAFSYVMDPERFFGDPAYMMEAVLRAGPHEDDDPRWRVLVMEDVDEFIHSTKSNGGVSRLLNLAEGLIGSGTRLLLFMTTNEEHGKVHPAVARKGRTFADVQFRLFGEVEAQKWLTAHGGGKLGTPVEMRYTGKGDTGPAYSLADLFQMGEQRV